MVLSSMLIFVSWKEDYSTTCSGQVKENNAAAFKLKYEMWSLSLFFFFFVFSIGLKKKTGRRTRKNTENETAQLFLALNGFFWVIFEPPIA